MYRNILVPLDGSMFSEHVLPLAIRIAHRIAHRMGRSAHPSSCRSAEATRID
jgi:hypothetical protein